MAPVDDIETYCDNGVWKTRWRDSSEPFAAGGGKHRQVSQGATVAQWYGVDHIITNPDGTTAEHNSYRYRREASVTGPGAGFRVHLPSHDATLPSPSMPSD